MNYSYEEIMCSHEQKREFEAIKKGISLLCIEEKEEKEYLDELVNAHWKYIEELLWAASQSITDEDRIHEIGFHYKTAFKHGWGHCREWHTGETL